MSDFESAQSFMLGFFTAGMIMGSETPCERDDCPRSD
jgi:hypothetical protein